MEHVKKYAAEFIGTMVLIVVACGSAYFYSDIGLLGVAFSFGLAVMCMAYAIGPVSGCHINPAVSLAMLITRRLSPVDFAGYVVSQIAGAFSGMFLVCVFLDDFFPGTYNTIDAVPSAQVGFLVEIILTFIFVFTVLGVTSKKENAKTAGLVIGLALTAVHIIGINLTGTSVNPARSIAPAVFNGYYDDLWVFIIGPFAGASVAAVASLWFHPKEKE